MPRHTFKLEYTTNILFFFYNLQLSINSPVNSFVLNSSDRHTFSSYLDFWCIGVYLVLRILSFGLIVC